jgi:MFS transporter, DHA3 family, macrolide efflux protein
VRTFTIIWSGQLVSAIGSQMTGFALTIWAWQLTGSVTALALVAFFSQLPSIPLRLFAGVIVDRFNRKHLMFLGDTISIFSSIAILLLDVNNNLQIWHLYLTGAFNSCFGLFQELAYSASLTMVVPKRHYTRASGMISFLGYGSAIFAPLLAGSLYPAIGLKGIVLIDIATFTVGVATLFFVRIPQPPSQTEKLGFQSLWQETLSGFHYLAKPGLFALLLITCLFSFFHDLGGTVYDAMILARTDNNATILGQIASAAGIGGVTGAVIIVTWGGFKRQIQGVLFSFVCAGISKIIFGFGQTPLIWIPAQFCSSMSFPLLESSDTAIWLAKVAPDVQGRVFAARSLLMEIITLSTTLIAGPLTDRVFEPAFHPGGILSSSLGGIFGTSAGAGMAFLYVLTSFGLLLVGLCGSAFPSLRNL